MKYSIITLLFLFATSFGHSQETLINDAQHYLNAFVENDYESLSSLTHRNIVDAAGGEDFYIKNIKEGVLQTTNQGLNYLSASVMVQNMEPYSVGKELHAIVPHDIIVAVGKQKFRAIDHILAVSLDDGASWQFVMLGKYSEESLRKYIPNLPKAFKIINATPFEELR